MPRYEVSVSNVFDADTPEDAVRQMAAWLDDYAMQAGYRVIDLKPAKGSPGNTGGRPGSWFIDASRLEPSVDW